MDKLIKNIKFANEYVFNLKTFKPIKYEDHDDQLEKYKYMQTHKLHMPCITITKEEAKTMMEFEEETERIFKNYSVY